jgi:hypothetical protein
MKADLTPVQNAALEQLRKRGGAFSASTVGMSMSTLDALVRKGYLECDRSRPGAFAFPRTGISYRVKE